MDDVGAKHPWLHQPRKPISQVWYLRARVPKDVPGFPTAEVKKSLGTSNYREACRLISAEAAAVERKFDEYRRYGGPPPEMRPQTSSRIPRAVTTPVVTIRYRGDGPPPSDLRSSEKLTEPEIRSFAVQAWRDWQDWVLAPLSSADPEWICEHAQLLEGDRWEQFQRPLRDAGSVFRAGTASFLENRGYYFDAQGSNAFILSSYLLRAGSEAYRRKIERLRGISTSADRDRLFDEISVLANSNFDKANAQEDELCERGHDLISEIQPWLLFLKSRGMKSRQLRQYESDLRKFATHLKTTKRIRVEELQKYYEKSLSGDAPNTVIRKFSVIRNYWRYLQANGLVSRTYKPFEGLMLPTKKAKNKRRTWTPEQVCEFWRIAKSRKDEPLALAISIAAFTGSRIEAICDLSKTDVFVASDGKLAFHFDDKTEPGIRDVPVHRSIEPMIAEMLAKASSNKDFLIKADTANQYFDRSTGIGKRFSRLKTELEYGLGFDFHSIRRTVVSLLFKVNCPEAIAADIVGHEKPTMTYGLYNEACDIEEKRRWLEHFAFTRTRNRSL